jgi:hypothetical protein|eukprot:SAG25_NODE_576_length_6788_cov_7.020033_6_plen_62_part_00
MHTRGCALANSQVSWVLVVHFRSRLTARATAVTGAPFGAFAYRFTVASGATPRAFGVVASV